MKFKVRIAVIIINIVTMFCGMLFTTVTVKDRMKLATTHHLEVNKYKEVNELVEKYVKAKKSEDYDTLADCVNNIEDTDKDEIKKENKYSSSVKNIKCYTIDGYYDNTYVVFVYQEDVWNDIDIVMPTVKQCYVCEYKGKLVIYSGTVGDSKKTKKIKDYNEKTLKNPEVKKLLQDVDASVLKLIQGNEVLSKLYEKSSEQEQSEQDKTNQDKTDQQNTNQQKTNPTVSPSPVPAASPDPNKAIG